MTCAAYNDTSVQSQPLFNKEENRNEGGGQRSWPGLESHDGLPKPVVTDCPGSGK